MREAWARPVHAEGGGDTWTILRRAAKWRPEGAEMPKTADGEEVIRIVDAVIAYIKGTGFNNKIYISLI
jgi:hypothetical protein